MNKTWNFASVATAECTCNFLRDAAESPDLPFVFDRQMNEYHLKYGAENASVMVIYYCPFCGGAAPKSKRDQFFASISQEEQQRLADMLDPINSIAAALSKLGPPQLDAASGTTVSHPARDSHPPLVEHFRMLTYETLSAVADVHITERRDGSVRWSLTGKYLGDI